MAIKERVALLEQKSAGANSSLIPSKERIIVIPYPNGQNQEFERQKKENIAKLRKKYGSTINVNDLMFIGIRKFCPQHVSSDDAKQ